MEREPALTQEQIESKAQTIPKKWSQRRYIIKSLIQITIVLSIYVLSIGPLFWNWFSSYHSMSSPFYATFYMPLLLACDYIPPLSDGVNWYINLWIG